MGHRALSLTLFLDLHLFGQFISFQKARGNSWNSLSLSITIAKKVCRYMSRVSANISLQQKIKIKTAQDWLSNVFRSQRRIMYRPKVDSGTLEQQGQWLPAAQIVQLINTFKQAVLQEIPKHCSMWCKQSARHLHDLIMLSMMFYDLPPIRLVSLRHIQLPGCLHCCDLAPFRSRFGAVLSPGELSEICKGDSREMLRFKSCRSRDCVFDSFLSISRLTPLLRRGPSSGEDRDQLSTFSGQPQTANIGL